MTAPLTQEALEGFYRSELRVLAANTNSTLSNEFIAAISTKLALHDPDNERNANTPSAAFIIAADALRVAIRPHEDAITEGSDASEPSPIEVFDEARAAAFPPSVSPSRPSPHR